MVSPDPYSARSAGMTQWLSCVCVEGGGLNIWIVYMPQNDYRRLKVSAYNYII